MNTTAAPLFTPLLMHDAPLASRTLLEQAHRYFGFVPNLIATMAHSPSALRVYLNADLGFQHGTLTPGEQQIVLLVASKENACRYCTTSHSALARFFANVPGDAIVAIENDRPLSDPKLNALVDLTRQLVSQRGYAPGRRLTHLSRQDTPKTSCLKFSWASDSRRSQLLRPYQRLN
jgi:alkylhydroperoxidase family enzyme